MSLVVSLLNLELYKIDQFMIQSEFREGVGILGNSFVMRMFWFLEGERIEES